MLEINTFSLILILGGLVMMGAVGLHYANCSKMIQKKRIAFESLSVLLEKKIYEMEQEVVDVRMQIDKINEQIKSLEP